MSEAEPWDETGEFVPVSDLILVRTEDGQVSVDVPHARFANPRQLALLPNGEGPFCRFQVGKSWQARSGVYVFTLDGAPVYVGKCANFRQRINAGYGRISPRNVYQGGQSTNCRVNRLILEALSVGRRIELWFRESPERFQLELELISQLLPPWNVQMPGSRRAGVTANERSTAEPEKLMRSSVAPKRADFEAELERRFREAEARGSKSVEVNSGDLHRAVGGYPGSLNRMPVCCDVLYAAIDTQRDEVLDAPPKGKGASLTIRYSLPRG